MRVAVLKQGGSGLHSRCRYGLSIEGLIPADEVGLLMARVSDC